MIALILALALGLPDVRLTPGAVLPVTAAQVCVKGYAGKVRHVSAAVKHQAYAEYGIRTHKAGAYEIDHLISLELGGSNALANLWPESYTGRFNAHQKDALENRLHALVCNGTITLAVAQHAIATNWITALAKYGGTAGPR